MDCILLTLELRLSMLRLDECMRSVATPEFTLHLNQELKRDVPSKAVPIIDNGRGGLCFI